MRFLAVAAFLALGAVPASAQLSKDYPHPDSTDSESWNVYCGGIEKEIQRQATEDNNQLQFSETQRRRDNLGAEMTHYFRSKEWLGKDSDLGWMAQGEKIAGKQVWDLTQLTNGDSAMRATVRLIRRNDLSTCDDLADRDVGFTTAGAK